MSLSSAARKESPHLDTLGGRIRALRLKLGFTVGEAGQVVKISRGSFTMWEKGKVETPDAGKLMILARKCDVSLDWLLKREGPDPDLRPASGTVEDAEHAMAVRKQNESQRDPIIDGLIDRIPPRGQPWPKEQRQRWQQLLAGALDLIYPDDDPSSM